VLSTFSTKMSIKSDAVSCAEGLRPLKHPAATGQTEIRNAQEGPTWLHTQFLHESNDFSDGGRFSRQPASRGGIGVVTAAQPKEAVIGTGKQSGEQHHAVILKQSGFPAAA
jgi:hypothetical protein